jgi:hypothetical protein
MNEIKIITQEQLDIIQDEYDDLVDKAITLENALHHNPYPAYTTEKELLDMEKGLSERAKNYTLIIDENIALNILRQFKDDLAFRKKILKIMEDE